MRTRFRWLLVGSLLVVTGTAGWVWSVLPNPAATHFGAGGRADGWMSPTENLLTMLGVGLLVVLGLPLLGWALARGSGAGVNVPYKEYWFAPERIDATRRALTEYMTVLGAWIGLLLAGVDATTVTANRRTPPSSGPETWVLLGLFLAGTLLWVVRLLHRFGRPPENRG